eukprot:857818-Rhodomonas_salina.1
MRREKSGGKGRERGFRSGWGWPMVRPSVNQTWTAWSVGSSAREGGQTARAKLPSEDPCLASEQRSALDVGRGAAIPLRLVAFELTLACVGVDFGVCRIDLTRCGVGVRSFASSPVPSPPWATSPCGP